MDFYGYDNLVKRIADKFLLEFEQMEAVYNFDIGDELEIAFCKVLRKFLPSKYGVVRGFVVSKDGDKVGDDVIIYDKLNFPTLRFLNDDDLIIKQQVPIESVYAYIEIKNTLDEPNLLKAVSQVKAVKEMCYKRNTMFLWNVSSDEKEYFSNKYSYSGAWEPTIINPVYGMIFSRFSVGLDNKKTDNCGKINEFAVKVINKHKKIFISNKHYNPEVIVFGQSNIAVSCHKTEIVKNGENLLELTKFHTGISPYCSYQINEHPNISFGLALAHLIMGLNSIKLLDMPWEKIFNCAKVPNSDYRKSIEDGLNG